MKVENKELFQNGNVLTSVLTLAVPTVIGQIILVIYNIADTFFVSMTGQDEMISAVTVCLPAFMFLSAISNLFGIGASSAMARALGRGKLRRARRASMFAFWACLAVTLLYSALAFLFLHPFVEALGGLDPEVHRMACGYLRVTVIGGGFCASMSALMSHLFRAEGRSVVSSFGVSMGGLLNVALDPLFMFVILPRGNEVMGAAIATGLSNLIAFLYFLIAFRRFGKKKTVLRIRMSLKQLKKIVKKKIPADIFVAGLPACLMTLFENISYAVLGNLLAHHSLAAHSGIGVAKKVNMLAHCIVRGMAQGVLPLIAFNYSAKDYKRMRSCVLTSMALSVGMATACMVVALVFAEPLIGLFIHGGTQSAHYGTAFLRILCVGGPFSACAYTLISFFQATGHGLRSFLLAILRKGALDIPLMLILGALGSVYMIVWATPIADVVCCLVAVALFLTYIKTKIQPNYGKETAA